MVKRIAEICTITAVVILMLMMFTAAESYADLKFKTTTLDMDELAPDEFYGKVDLDQSSTETIKDVEVYGDNVIYVDYGFIYDDQFSVQAVGYGDAYVTVTGSGGSTANVYVHVGYTALQNALNNMSMTGTYFYGSPVLEVESLPSANYTLEIGGDTYTGQLEELIYFEAGKEIKLKKFYDVGTKIKLTVEKSGLTSVKTDKVRKDTSAYRIKKASGKTFKFSAYNMHKGDVVKIKYKGRTYSTKIKKNYNEKYATVTVKTKKTITSNAKVTYEICNKFKTVLDNRTCKLKKGKWSR